MLKNAITCVTYCIFWIDLRDPWHLYSYHAGLSPPDFGLSALPAPNFTFMGKYNVLAQADARVAWTAKRSLGAHR